MNIAILKTAVFPDRDTVAEAVNFLIPHYNLYECDLTKAMNDEDWDQVLDEVLAADRVVVL